MQELVEAAYPRLHVTQDLGLGMLLWLAHFSPQERWSMSVRARSLATLDTMWVDPPGYFCREPALRHLKCAFTNYGVSVGLQAVGAFAERVTRLNHFFANYHSHDHYDTDAITHVMCCSSWFPGLLL